ncbi:MAG: hypothetical protein LIP28_07760 [Deltaproteobacteria bacterium]|nr:hypothetical protein [Deltaproteobacteria bacterium]
MKEPFFMDLATLATPLARMFLEAINALSGTNAAIPLGGLGRLFEREPVTGLPLGLIIVIPLLFFLALFHMEGRRLRRQKDAPRHNPQPVALRNTLPEGHVALENLSGKNPRENELKGLILSCRGHSRWYPIVIMGGCLCLMASLRAFAGRSVTWLDHGLLTAGIGALLWVSLSLQARLKKRRTIERLRRELHEETGKFYPGLE